MIGGKILKKLKELPEPVLKQVLLRWICGLGFLCLSVILCIAYRDRTFLISALILSAVLFILGFRILGKAVREEYLVIHGECKQIDTTPVRKQVKSITVRTKSSEGEDMLLKLTTKRKKRSIWIGCNVEVYLDKKTTLYERDGIYIVGNFLNMRILH